MEKKVVSSRFSEKAASYEKYAFVQKKMADHLLRMVTETSDSSRLRSLAEIGCGTGGLTRDLRSYFPDAQYEAVEIAAGMLEQAKKVLQSLDLPCAFILADAEEWVWKQRARSKDLIVSGACFQWFAKPELTLRGIANILAPGAPLLFSTFGPGTFRELHASFAHAHALCGERGVRHGLTFLSSNQWRELLMRAGFTRIEITTQDEMLTYPRVWDFLHAVKAVGASASTEQSNGLGGRRLLTEMTRYYERNYRSEAGIRVTYEVIYVRAVKSK